MLTTLLAFANTIAIIPQPSIVIPQPGGFDLNAQTVISADKGLANVATRLREYWKTGTGLELPNGSSTSNVIRIKLDSKAKLGEEGYRLTVDPQMVEIVAAKPAGAFYAVQSLRQLLPADSFGNKKTSQKLVVPSVIIEDVPRFSWRGSMLDTGRHFMPKEAIKKYIDTLALHKLNVFHWHLTEDQGWRLEIKKYPKLTSVGSTRSKTMLKYSPAEYENKPYGGFYTQQDAKEIVKYAAERYVTVVPEIEMPGHSQAAIAAYPELGNTKDQLEVANKWGVVTHVYNPELTTIKFLQDVLDEVMAIFPSKYIHIGGDECPKDEWKASPRVQQLIKERGLKDEHEMQSWFIGQMDKYLASKGRNLIGWDEILEGGLAPGAAVMSWRGEAGGIAAAKAKHNVVMASNNAFYFDYYQADPKNEPHAIGGFLPLKKVYDFDILPAALKSDERKYIIGGQFQIWTEYIRTPEYAEYMAFPRGCAAAEVLWSAKSKKNFRNFVERLTTHADRLTALGVNFRPLDPGVAGVAAEWKSGDFSNDYQVKSFNITQAVPVAGSYTVLFQYTGGGQRLDVDGIEILVNGEVAATDPHYGRTGSVNVDNLWKFNLKNLPKGAKVELRIKARGDGGGDTNGDITITKA